jgi:hypothetical protein
VGAQNAGAPNTGADEAGAPNKDDPLEAKLPNLGLGETDPPSADGPDAPAPTPPLELAAPKLKPVDPPPPSPPIPPVLAPPKLSRFGASSAGELLIADAIAPKPAKLPPPLALPNSPLVAIAPADAAAVPTEPDVLPNTIAATGANCTLPVCDGVLLPKCAPNAAPLASDAAPASSSSSSVS